MTGPQDPSVWVGDVRTHLAKALGGADGSPPKNFELFREYLSRIGATTLVVESSYVDRDYLSDYLAFYASCFKPYTRTCKRVHFFSAEFTAGQFFDLLERPWSKDDPFEKVLRSERCYLGFMVVRPLPQAPIGRTCLATYPPNPGSNRSFPTLSEHKVSLCGIDFAVDSVPFQEQDTVTAACATSALWSAFNVSGKLFHHKIPSPVAITQSALSAARESRGIPDPGLQVSEMASAIRNLGLEPLSVNPSDLSSMLSAIYAYTSAGIPAILVMQFFDGNHKEGEYHAVTVCGFNVNCSGAAQPHSLTSDGIDTLFAHDDQIVPFAKITFEDISMPPDGGGALNSVLSLVPALCHFKQRWFSRRGQTVTVLKCPGYPDGEYSVPKAVLLPLYHKIRVPFASVHEHYKAISLAVEAALADPDLAAAVQPSGMEEMRWDLRLVCCKEYKADLRKSPTSYGLHRSNVLQANMPRYLWKLSAKAGAETCADILFDATDFAGGNEVHAFVCHDQRGDKIRAALAEVNAAAGEWAPSIIRQIVAIS